MLMWMVMVVGCGTAVLVDDACRVGVTMNVWVCICIRCVLKLFLYKSCNYPDECGETKNKTHIIRELFINSICMCVMWGADNQPATDERIPAV